MDVATFFGTMRRLMANNPPTPAEIPLFERFGAIGFVPGRSSTWAGWMRRQKGAGTCPQGRSGEDQNAPSRCPSLTENGWLVNRTGMGTYGTDYPRRAYVALIGLGANLPQDAIYPMTKVDGEGKPLTGASRYVLHFGKGQTPPVNAFWSVTMYDMDQFFVPNPIDRYAIGDRDKLRFNDDGSLDLFIQHDSPGADRESNWLPAPAGQFNLIMRIYWPKESVIDGSWKIPGVRRAP